MQARGSFPAEMLAKVDIVITKEGSILQNSTIIKLVLSTTNNACGGEGISRLAGNAINRGSIDVEQGPGLGIRRDRQVTEVHKREDREELSDAPARDGAEDVAVLTVPLVPSA
jgi:hypothetical protein